MQLTPIPQVTTSDDLVWLLGAIDQLIAVAGALIPLAQAWGFCFAVFSFVVICFRGCIYAIQHQTENIVPEFVFWLGKVLFVSFALSFYINPIPGFGVAFPDLFSLIGRQIAGTISLQTLDNLLLQINTLAQGMEHPPVWNFFGLIVYFFVLVAMTILDGALLLITSFGFFAIGIGKVFGSILITFLLLPGWGQKFWNWVNFMFVYAMYRAVAAAIVFVVATFFSNFLQNTMNGNYTLGHLIPLFTFMLSSVLVVVLLAFKAPSITTELFGGGLGHSGQGFGESMRALVYMLARK